jgi:hypothetical protein
MNESTTRARLPGTAARRFGHVCGFLNSQADGFEQTRV